MNNLNAAITAVAGWVPEDRLTNHDLEKLVDTNNEWILSRTGIQERRILREEGKGTSFLATKACELLLEKRGISAQEVDLIICATATPDMGFVSTANIVAHQLGTKQIMSFDVQAACSGFVYALEIASNFVKSGLYKKVIVVGADKMSSVIDYTDRNSCILFGDGAGAVLVEPNTEEGLGIIDAVLKSDGIGKDFLHTYQGGSAHPLTPQNIAERRQYFFQDGKTVFKHAVTSMADVSVEVMQRNQLVGEQIAYLVPHQANMRIIQATAKRMDVSMEKVAVNIHQYGNTTGATIPLCLADYEEQFKKGDNLILSAFGGGFTWGAMYMKWAY